MNEVTEWGVTGVTESMRLPSTPSLRHSLPPHLSPAAPLFLWLVIQLIAFALAVFRVPLSARFPPPGEQFAIHVMLVTQIVSSAMLFPLLLRDLTSSIVVILTTLPFIHLASYLSSTPTSRAALAAAYVAIWLATLATCRVLLRSRAAEMLGVAVAMAWSLGMAMVWYATVESRHPPIVDWRMDGRFGPILGAMAQIESPQITAGPWSIALIALGGFAAIAIATHFRRQRSVGRSGTPSEAG